LEFCVHHDHSFFSHPERLSAIKDLLPLLPTLVEVDVLEKCYVHLKKFHDINIMLQKEKITFLKVREIFDTVMDDFPNSAAIWLPMQK
jgi:hypothetical protein